MPGPKVEKDVRRAQILQAAHHVAGRVGLDALTVRLVAAKAKLSSGLVFFYFKTKERLLAALLGDVLKPATVLRPAKEKSWAASPLTRLRSLLRREIIRSSGEPSRVRLFFEYWVKGFRNPEIRAKMRAELQRQRDAFQPAAAAVLAADPARFPDGTAEGLAAVAVGVVEGGAVQAVTDPKHFDVKAYLTAADELLKPAG